MGGGTCIQQAAVCLGRDRDRSHAEVIDLIIITFHPVIQTIKPEWAIRLRIVCHRGQFGNHIGWIVFPVFPGSQVYRTVLAIEQKNVFVQLFRVCAHCVVGSNEIEDRLNFSEGR